MVIIRRYLIKQVFYHLSLIVLLLLGIHFALELSYELGFLRQGNFGIKEAIGCALLHLPYDLYVFSPIAVMFTFLWSFGVLNLNRELIIIRLNGYSVWRLLCEGGVLILGMIVFLFLVGEVFSPLALNMSNHLKIQAIAAGNLSVTPKGNWLKQGKYFLTFQNFKGKELEGVWIYKLADNDAALQVWQAPKAEIVAHTITLFNGKNNFFSGNRINQRSFIKETLPIRITLNLQWMKKDADQYSLLELWKIFNERHDLGMDYLKYEVIYWQRVFTPLAILILAWLGILFVLKSSRGKLARQFLIGVVISFSYYTLTQMSGYLAMVYNLSAWFCTLLPSLGGLGIVGWFLFIY